MYILWTQARGCSKWVYGYISQVSQVSLGFSHHSNTSSGMWKSRIRGPQGGQSLVVPLRESPQAWVLDLSLEFLVSCIIKLLAIITILFNEFLVFNHWVFMIFDLCIDCNSLTFITLRITHQTCQLNKTGIKTRMFHSSNRIVNPICNAVRNIQLI